MREWRNAEIEKKFRKETLKSIDHWIWKCLFILNTDMKTSKCDLIFWIFSFFTKQTINILTHSKAQQQPINYFANRPIENDGQSSYKCSYIDSFQSHRELLNHRLFSKDALDLIVNFSDHMANIFANWMSVCGWFLYLSYSIWINNRCEPFPIFIQNSTFELTFNIIVV